MTWLPSSELNKSKFKEGRRRKRLPNPNVSVLQAQFLCFQTLYGDSSIWRICFSFALEPIAMKNSGVVGFTYWLFPWPCLLLWSHTDIQYRIGCINIMHWSTVVVDGNISKQVKHHSEDRLLINTTTRLTATAMLASLWSCNWSVLS